MIPLMDQVQIWDQAPQRVTGPQELEDEHKHYRRQNDGDIGG